MKMQQIAVALSAAATLYAGAAAAAGNSMPGPVTTERLANAAREPQNWLNHHGNLWGHRYSPLDQINRSTVKNLKVAWTMALGGIEAGGIWPHGGLEGTPIVEDGYMYVTDGWGSVYKIDMRKGSGKLLWRMDPKTEKDYAGAVTCCGINNRGVGLWQDKVISHALDGRLIITDKDTGEITFQRKVADPDLGEVITGAPLIVKDLAITGVAGAEYGIRGWLAATDLKTGKEVWRTYTIPAPGEPGSETWKDNHGAWKNGGGSTWVTGTYDPKSDLIYWGVGNPGPDWDNAYRPGDNLYTNSTIALKADTGQIVWHFQHTPNDPYDYDSVSENTVVEGRVGGKPRKAVLHANRNGFVYAFDSANGKFIWGTQFTDRLTWTDGLDENGRPKSYNPNSDVQKYKGKTAPARDNKYGLSCPGNMGGKNWPPTAYNPNLNYYYIPVIESCNEMINEPAQPGAWKSREFWTGGGLRQVEHISGSVAAVDVNSGEVVAKYKTQYPMLGGVLATRDLVFVGRPEGTLAALDAKTLKELWTFETGSGINAPPMTFSVNGKQYVAVLVGLGGAWPKWFVDGTKGLEKVQPGSTLYVFSL